MFSLRNSAISPWNFSEKLAVSPWNFKILRMAVFPWNKKYGDFSSPALYGLRSFRYEAAWIWICLPNDLRKAESPFLSSGGCFTLGMASFVNALGVLFRQFCSVYAVNSSFFNPFTSFVTFLFVSLRLDKLYSYYTFSFSFRFRSKVVCTVGHP